MDQDSDLDEMEGGDSDKLIVNPDIPLRLLFALSAFPLEYLMGKAGSERRFPFLKKSETLCDDNNLIAKALIGKEQKQRELRSAKKKAEKEAAELREREAKKERR